MNKMILSCIFVAVCALLVAAVLRVRNVRARREQLTTRPAPLNECGQQEALPDMTPSDLTTEQLLAIRVTELESRLNDYRTGNERLRTMLYESDERAWQFKNKLEATQSAAEARREVDATNLRDRADEIQRLRNQLNGRQPVPQDAANANGVNLVALKSEFQEALANEQELYLKRLWYLLGLSKEEFNEVVTNVYPDIARQISRLDQVPLIDHRDIPVDTDEMDIDTMAPTSTEHQQTDINAMPGVEYTGGTPSYAQYSDMGEIVFGSVSGHHENAPNERETVTQGLSNLEREIAQLVVPSRSHLQGCFNAIDRLKIALGNQDAAHAQLGSESRRAVKEDNRDSQFARDSSMKLDQPEQQQCEAELRRMLRFCQEDGRQSRGDAEHWFQKYLEVFKRVSELESRCKSLDKQAQINDPANGG